LHRQPGIRCRARAPGPGPARGAGRLAGLRTERDAGSPGATGPRPPGGGRGQPSGLISRPGSTADRPDSLLVEPRGGPPARRSLTPSRGRGGRPGAITRCLTPRWDTSSGDSEETSAPKVFDTFSGTTRCSNDEVSNTWIGSRVPGRAGGGLRKVFDTFSGTPS